MATALVSPIPHPSTNGVPHAPTPASDISATLMVITPAMAQELLKNRLPNRPISKARVRSMIDDLRRDRWQTNGESIILDQDLHLLDGQHRLMAVSESGISITALVVVGVDPSVRNSIDQGKSKGGSDVLHMAQMAHAQHLSSAAKWLWRYENQRMRQTTVLLRNQDLPAFVTQHPGLPAALTWGRSLTPLIPGGAASALYFLMHQRDPGLAKQTFHRLATGLELTADDPLWAVREGLLKRKEPSSHAGTVARCARIVLAWNRAHQGGSGASSLAWKGTTDASVAFPVIL